MSTPPSAADFYNLSTPWVVLATGSLITANAHDIISRISDSLDGWREVDQFYAGLLANYVALGFKYSREWQKFQWFDGITPRYHWSISKNVAEWAGRAARRVNTYRPGCYYIEK